MAFSGHRHCCRECRLSQGELHGWRCAQRQSHQQPPNQPQDDPAGKNREDDKLALVKDLVQRSLLDLPPDRKRRWLLDLQRAFHADRNGDVLGFHAISVYLNTEIEKLG